MFRFKSLLKRFVLARPIEGARGELAGTDKDDLSDFLHDELDEVEILLAIQNEWHNVRDNPTFLVMDEQSIAKLMNYLRKESHFKSHRDIEGVIEYCGYPVLSVGKLDGKSIIMFI